MAIGNAQNAGLLAIQILACQRPDLLEQVQAYRQSLTATVESHQQQLADQGYQAYLNGLEAQSPPG